MRRSKTIMVGVVTAALLGGCALGPDYKRPTVATPPTFRGQGEGEGASLADAPWWDVFQDPTLKQLIREALRNNHDVRIAAARVEEARARLLVSRSELFPSLDANVGAARAKIPPRILGGRNVEGEARDAYFGALSMSWELDIWGRVRRASEAARATLLATDEARRAVWLTLVSDLAQAYFELLALDVQRQITHDSVSAYQGTYDLFRDRLTQGVASELETSRARGALGAAQATLPRIESEIVAKENQIRILLGTTPGPVVRGNAMYDQPVVPAVPAGLPSALLERRPDLRQAEQQLVAANARIGIAKAEFFPRLSLTALLGAASPELTALTGGTASLWAIGGTLSGPVFNAGRNLGRYQGAIAQWEQTRLHYEQAVLTALREVSDSLIALGRLADAEQVQAAAVTALAAAVEHALGRYQHGLASYFEVLEAQQQLYPAQRSLAEIRRERLLAHVRLYKALGGGWSLSDAQWAHPDTAAAK